MSAVKISIDEGVNLKLLIPNIFTRSNLFSTGKSKIRPCHENIELNTCKGTSIYFTGEELRQDDLDVFLALLYFNTQKNYGPNSEKHEKKSSYRVVFKLKDILKMMNWSYRSAYIEKLNLCLDRLLSSNISIKTNDYNIDSRLILEVERPVSNRNDPYICLLSDNILCLLTDKTTTFIPSWQRKSLNSFGKWLHAYYGSHAQPLPISVDFLQKLSGSKIEKRFKFRQKLYEELDNLKSVGFLDNFKIDESDKVHVLRSRKINNSHSSIFNNQIISTLDAFVNHTDEKHLDLDELYAIDNFNMSKDDFESEVKKSLRIMESHKFIRSYFPVPNDKRKLHIIRRGSKLK